MTKGIYDAWKDAKKDYKEAPKCPKCGRVLIGGKCLVCQKTKKQ